MQILKNSAIYLGSSILNKAIPFLLLPILTQYLTPSEYGLLAIFQMMITFFTPLVGMAINTNIAKQFFHINQEQLAELNGNILMILSCSTAIVASSTLLITLGNETFFSVPSSWVRIMPLLSFMFMVNTVNLTILRMQSKAITYGIFEVSNTALNIGVTLLFLVVYEMGWYSRAIGITVAYLTFFLISFFFMRSRGQLRWKFSSVQTKSILSLSLPLIPHALGSVVIAVSDRFFIERMVDLETVGIYSVGYMFGMVVLLFSEAFVKAWNPWFFKKLSAPTLEVKRLIVKYTYMFLFGIIFLMFLVTILGNLFLPLIVEPAYQSAGVYIFWIALGYVFFAAYQIFFPYLVHMGRTAFLAKSTVLAASINLILNYFLIKEFGAIGAAYATIVAFLVSGLMVFWYQQKHYAMPWKIWKHRSENK